MRVSLWHQNKPRQGGIFVQQKVTQSKLSNGMTVEQQLGMDLKSRH